MTPPPATGPLRVLHVFPSFELGGAQARTLRLAAELGPEFEHAVLPLDGRTDALGRAEPGAAPELVTPPPRRGTPATVRALARTLRERRPDLLATYNWGSFDAWVAARLVGLRAHVHHEDGFGSDESAGQLVPRRGVARRLLLRRARAVVVPSTVLERIALERWRLPRGVVRLVPNGVDLARFAAGDRGARARLDLPDGALLLGFVGGLRPEKNPGRLLEAVAALPADSPWRLVVVGDGALRGALEARAAEPDLAGRATFVGLQADTAPWLRAFDAFALSSDTEQMPLALCEAMAASLPIVATAVGDVGAISPPEQAPFLVEAGPGAAEGLAAGLARLGADPALRARLGAANRARVEARYDLATMVAAYRALYRSAAGAPGA